MVESVMPQAGGYSLHFRIPFPIYGQSGETLSPGH